MTDAPSWEYDELVQIGKDFASREVVAAYDAWHRQFREVEKENQAIIKGLGLKLDHTVADFGSGTGAFARQAARICARVYAIDISPAMMDYNQWKAREQGLTNIVFCPGGFLTYHHAGAPLDAVSTSMALHHLPDFWKQKALNRLNHLLKPHGRLFLGDVVFAEKDYDRNIPAWIDSLIAKAGPSIAKDICRHVAREHSTFTWIMEGLLTRAGFRIDQAEYADGVMARYFCTKV